MPIGIYKHKPHSKETRNKIGNSNRGRILSEESRKNMSIAHIGVKQSEESKRKISESTKGKSKSNGKLGTKQSEDTKKKIGNANRAEKCSLWKGGISYQPYPLDWTEILRTSIRLRDNFMCFECGIHQDELYKKLSVHHIDYDKNNCNPENLITLCNSCHVKTNSNRDYWMEYFKELLPAHRNE